MKEQRVTTMIEIDPQLIMGLIEQVNVLTVMLESMKKEQFDPLVSAKRAAELFNCSTSVIYSLPLTKYRINGLIRYKKSELDKLIIPA